MRGSRVLDFGRLREERLAILLGHDALGGLQSEEPEERGVDEEVEQRRTDDSSEDHGRDRVQDFLARFAGRQDQRNEADSGGEGGHQNGSEPFQSRAKEAYGLCLEAIEAEGKTSANTKWKAVFGKPVPASKATETTRESFIYKDTEEFIEDLFPVDIRKTLKIDCTVTQNGFRPHRLRDMLRTRTLLRPRKSLDFSVEVCDVTPPYDLKWKVLNRGEEAKHRNLIRGQIVASNRVEGRHERTEFRGEHYVECYVVKDGIVIARDRLQVPITPE